MLAHNALGILTGFSLARIFRLPSADQKTLAIETGIQNSGLGLGLIFAFFDGMGGMAIVAGWWGIWHIISGLSIAYFLKKQKALGLNFMEQGPQSKMLIQLVTMRMPYGKYKGTLLCDLPEPYLSWYNAKGFP